MKKVFVGLSGGVDSSLAAYLLKQEGYQVVGVHIRSWNVNGCDVPEAEDARRVASHLNIPFYVFDMTKEYKQTVVDYMINGYRKGLTPNPDVMCNKEVKFGLFLNKALEMGADYIATGHYVRLIEGRKIFSLAQAKDKNKDQSYFLWTLSQDQLKHCLFPVGDYTKKEVRALARAAGLPTADKKDSQGICFVGKITLPEFLSQYIDTESGKILTTEGKVVGTHSGVQFFTIGQRQGLGVALNTPHYVSQKDIETNTVVLAAENDSTLYQKDITLSNVNFINPGVFQHFQDPRDVLARIRYRQPLVQAKLYKLANLQTYQLAFSEPQKAVAPGQSAVFYSNDSQLLGGGIIQ